LKRPITETERDLSTLGLVSRYDDGYFFDKAGFALQVIGGLVEAVSVYRKGYYDNE
jgi:hypothetical protein